MNPTSDSKSKYKNGKVIFNVRKKEAE